MIIQIHIINAFFPLFSTNEFALKLIRQLLGVISYKPGIFFVFDTLNQNVP